MTNATITLMKHVKITPRHASGTQKKLDPEKRLAESCVIVDVCNCKAKGADSKPRT